MRFHGLIFLAVSTAVFAQGLDSTLAPIAAKHRTDLATVETQKKTVLARAQHDYITALDSADKSATAAGDLKGVVALGKERDLAKTKPDLALSFPADLPAALVPARKVYLDAIASVNADASKRIQQIDGDYLRTLGMLDSHAASNPALAQQIAAEKAELIRRESAPTSVTTATTTPAAATASSASAKPGKPAATPAAALVEKLGNGTFAEADANGLPIGWTLCGSLDKGKVLPDGVSIKTMQENGISFVRMTFDGRYHNCGIAQELAVPNRARTATIKVWYRGKVTGRLQPTDRRCWPNNDLGFYNEKGALAGHGFTNIEDMILHKASSQPTHNQASFKTWERTIPVPDGAIKGVFKLENGNCTGVFDFEHAEVTFK